MNRAQRRQQAKQDRLTQWTERDRVVNDRLHIYYQNQMNERVEEINEKLRKEHEEYLRLEKELREERENNIENDWYWFFSCLAIMLKRKYHKNDKYIENFITKVNEQITDFQTEGMTRDDLIRMAEEETGIILCTKE